MSEGRMRQFVADASHELRTPLAAVSAYAELFEQGAATRADDLERVMHGIRNETARMGHLVEDLLLLARLDEGRPLEREEVELVGVAAEAVKTATTVGPQWPVRLVGAATGGDRRRPHADPPGARQPARQRPDPLPGGNVERWSPSTRRGHDAVISVEDEGPGLSPEDGARVFERFFRADVSRSRRHGGAGLGLSIVASITKAHGGTVECRRRHRRRHRVHPAPAGLGSPEPEGIRGAPRTGAHSQLIPSRLCEDPEIRMVTCEP